MARGSKYMYERLEHGIDKAYTADSGFLDTDLGSAIRNEFYENLLAMGEYTYLPRHGALPLSDYNYHTFSLDGGKFSSSKINIMLGYLLVCVWMALTMLNPAFVEQSITLVADWFRILIVGALIFIVLLIIFRRKMIAILTALLIIPVVIYWGNYTKLLFSYVPLGLDIILAFLISYEVLSDNYLNLKDYLAVLFRTTRSSSPDKKQKEWVHQFFKNGDLGVLLYIVKVFKDYKNGCDDSLQRMILDEFIRAEENDSESRWKLNREMITKGAVARLLSNEYLKNLFETAIMQRSEFNEPFVGLWGDESGNQLDFNETNNKKVYVTFPSAGLNGEDFDLSDNTKLFADTDWTSIRAGNDYELIKDDKCIHLIQKRNNGRRVYMTIDGKDSLLDKSLKEKNQAEVKSDNPSPEQNEKTDKPSKLKVTLTVIDTPKESGEKKQHTYEYTLTKKEGDAPDNNKKQDTVVDGKKKFHVSGTVSFDLNADVEEIKDEQGSAEQGSNGV